MKSVYVFIGLLLSTTLVFNSSAQVVTLTPVINGMTNPVGIENCNDSRLFIVLQGGRIMVADSNNIVAALPFLNIANKATVSSETGLLGLAFHPDYKNNGYFYISYNRTLSGQLQSVVSRFQVRTDDANRADSLSEQILFTINQPFSNHNGGSVKFGPDGYLYLGFGDGGSGNDPQRNGQNMNTMLGKILRIDVDKDSLYAIPPDNPFVGVANHKEEIWASGMRNPWRISFDRFTGDLWIADVGQGVWEEIDFQPNGAPGGRNYGWVCYEGYVPNITGNCPPDSTLTYPVHVYNHSSGNCSVTGGYVYRGARVSDMFGKYIFSDYCSGIVRAFDLKDSSVTVLAQGNHMSSLGEDIWGELYICDYTSNRILRIDPIGCKPVSYVFNTDSISICNGTTTELTALAGYHFTYQWYRDSVAVDNANSSALQTPGTGKYYLVVSNAPGCSVQSKIVTVANFPGPGAVITPVNDVCGNGEAVLLAAGVNGGTFTGEGVVDDYFYPADGLEGENTIYYAFTDTNNCSFTDSAKFEVFPVPDVLINMPDDLCRNAAPLLLSANFAGGVFGGDGVDTAGYFNPSLVAVGEQTVYYTYTDSNSCSNSDTTTFNILELPGIFFEAESVCSNVGPVTLEVTPEGGTWFGNGISNNLFYPDSVPSGEQVAYYTYTDTTTGCSNTDSVGFSVFPSPLAYFVIGKDTLCDVGGTPVPFTASPAGGIFSGDVAGVNGDGMSFDNYGQVNYVTYTVTDINGCTSSATDSILVDFCGGVEDISHSTIKVYPNPAQDRVIISGFSNIKVQTIQLTNALGQKVLETVVPLNQNTMELVLPASPGLYIIHIKGEKEEYVTRVFKE